MGMKPRKTAIPVPVPVTDPCPSPGTRKTLREYFIVLASNAAPFVSDADYRFVKAISPEQAIEAARREYDHPFGLYAARAWASADAFHKNKPHIAEWLSERAKELLYK